MKRLPFSLRALLILLTLIAVYLAGRRGGYQCGYIAAEEEYGVGGPALNNAYPVSDLVLPSHEIEPAPTNERSDESPPNP